MEGVSVSFYNGFRNYWRRRRRGYERLAGTGRRRKNRVELGSSGSNRRKRFWRIKITPKLRFSPKKFFLGIRDAYVNMMLGLASSRAISGGRFMSGHLGDGLGGFGMGPRKEYDEKMIVETYKSLVIAQGLVPRDAPRIAPHIVARC